MPPDPPERLVLWATDLSPYALKLRAMLDFVGANHRCLPREGGRLDAARMAARIERGRRQRTILRHPRTTALDEYPQVPFLEDPQGQLHYDSSGLARWIDATRPVAGCPLVPAEPRFALLAALLDEAFDEFGLYMAHHNRWVVSADTNRASLQLAEDFAPLLTGPIARQAGRRFGPRQTRRLPYLFSVAPSGCPPGPAGPLPAPAGFPPTHALLEQAWRAYVLAMESILAQQPFLLGDRFTLADASAYGEISMNLVDGRAAERLRELAPRTFAWLGAIRDGEHRGARGSLRVAEPLGALLEIVGETFVPLMQQNEAAYEKALAEGQTRFNEAAFDAGEALYDGALLGHPFRAVVKTFQVQVWRELREAFAGVPADEWPELPDATLRALRD